VSLLLPSLIALILFGGGGFYFSGPINGGIGIGVILLLCLLVYIAGGFRNLKSLQKVGFYGTHQVKGSGKKQTC
jgi:hypothetical protein